MGQMRITLRSGPCQLRLKVFNCQLMTTGTDLIKKIFSMKILYVGLKICDWLKFFEQTILLAETMVT